MVEAEVVSPLLWLLFSTLADVLARLLGGECCDCSDESDCCSAELCRSRRLEDEAMAAAAAARRSSWFTVAPPEVAFECWEDGSGDGGDVNNASSTSFSEKQCWWPRELGRCAEN